MENNRLLNLNKTKKRFWTVFINKCIYQHDQTNGKKDQIKYGGLKHCQSDSVISVRTFNSLSTFKNPTEPKYLHCLRNFSNKKKKFRKPRNFRVPSEIKELDRKEISHWPNNNSPLTQKISYSLDWILSSRRKSFDKTYCQRFHWLQINQCHSLEQQKREWV